MLSDQFSIYNIIGLKGKKPKILVVDDEEINRLLLGDILVPIGFEIIDATDGYECLEKTTLHKPDLIVMDLLMPRMNGFKATEKLRQLPGYEKTIIIAASASAFGYDQQKSFQVGCDDFIAKPIKFIELLQKLQLYLDLEWVYR